MQNKMLRINEKAALNASEALSKLIDSRISIRIPGVEVKEISKLSSTIFQEEIVVGIYLPITGDLTGAALLVFPEQTAYELSDILVKRKPGTTRKLSELDKSALKEVGNILSGNYLAVISNLLKIKIIEHVPNFSFGMFGAIMSQVASKFAQEAEKALAVEIEFIFESMKLKGFFYLLFTLDKLNAILESPTDLRIP